MPESIPARHEIGANRPPIEVRLAEDHGPLKLRVDALLIEAGSIPAKIETPEQFEAATTTQRALAAALKDVETAHTAEKATVAPIVRAIDGFFLTNGLKGRLEPTLRVIANRNGAYQAELAEAKRREEAARAAEAAEAARKKLDEAAELEAAGRHTEAAVRTEGALAQDMEAEKAAHRAGGSDTTLGRVYTGAGTSSLKITAKIVVDSDTVDLEKLRPYLPLAALEEAVRQMARVKNLKHQDLLDGKLPIKGVTYEKQATSSAR